MKSVLASVMVLAMGLGACRVSVETQTRYTRSGGDEDYATATSDTAYAAGDKVSVNLLGVEASGIGVSLNGGVTVKSGDVDKVSVRARVIAWGYSEDEPQAADAIGQVSNSVKVTKSGDTWNVTCDKIKVGDASAGCEFIEVTVPRGTEASPLNVSVDSELGNVQVDLPSEIVKSLGVNADGPDPGILASVQPAVGATIELVSDDGLVRLNVPKDFTADEVRLTGRTEAEASKGENYSDSDFSGANFSGSAFSVGELSTGAARVTLSGEAVRLKDDPKKS